MGDEQETPLAEVMAKEMVERLQKFSTRKWSGETLGDIRTDVHAFVVERFPEVDEERLAHIVLVCVTLDDASGRLEMDFEKMVGAITDPELHVPAPGDP
jgi:hypothetical protein